MKRLIYIFFPAVLLFAGCKPNEPVAEITPEPQQEETYIEWADNPFWGPVSGQLEQMGLLDTWNDWLNANDDPAFPTYQLDDDGIPYDMDAPAGEVDKWKRHQERLSIAGLIVGAAGIIVSIADVALKYGDRATAKAQEAISQLNKAGKTVKDVSTKQKDIQRQLSGRIQLMCQIINDVCKKEVIRRQEIDLINQQYNYINECHDRSYYNLTFATPYWNEMMAINKHYRTEDTSVTMTDTDKRNYYREVYTLLSEWAQPDYSNVFEAINYAHYLSTQRGNGMPTIYMEWAEKACMWGFERQNMLSQMALQDITTMVFTTNLATAYLHACQYLQVGMEIHVTYEVEKQLSEEFVKAAEVYQTMLEKIQSIKNRQCFIPGAEFVSEDSVLTAIPYKEHKWTKYKNYSPELLVYGYYNNKDAKVEKGDVIPDSIANRIISFYGNQYTLAHVLISQGGFMVPKGYEQTYLSDIEILASGTPKGDVNEGLASIYAPGGFNKAQRADEHLTRWMGTAIINNGKMTGWADFASPSVWMTVHGKIKSKK